MEGRNSDTPCRVRCIVVNPCFQGFVDGSADRSKQWVHADRRLDRKPVKKVVVLEVGAFMRDHGLTQCRVKLPE